MIGVFLVWVAFGVAGPVKVTAGGDVGPKLSVHVRRVSASRWVSCVEVRSVSVDCWEISLFLRFFGVVVGVEGGVLVVLVSTFCKLQVMSETFCCESNGFL